MKRALLLLFMFASLGTLAQTTVSGIVNDNLGEPLGYASVLVKGTSVGSLTDLEGKFTVTVPNGYNVLVVSYTGFPTQEIEINGQTSITVQMEKAGLDLNPVVVSASRRQEKQLEAPASIDVITAKEVQVKVSTSPTDYISDVSGVDIMKTGIAQSNVVLRGFNNIFSGSALTLVDYRIGSVPSLRVNVNQLMPGNYLDIDRVEVLKGPASALYGPNAANGAIHFMTKSPLDEEHNFSTTLSSGIGERNTFIEQFRQTAKLKRGSADSPLQIGLRVSGQYMSANDWAYDDPAEPDSVIFGKQTADGKIPYYANGTEVSAEDLANGETGDYVPNPRNNNLVNYNGDARLDFRFNPNTELIFSGGYSSASGIELTGLGAGQAVNWSYYYTQARFRWKNLFIQGYMNSSDAGDTYLLRSGNYIVDKSKFYVGQIQHSYEVGKFRLIYGADALLTRPDTEGTINGRNEDDDNIDIYGAYLQGEYEPNDWLKFVAAARYDYNTAIQDPFISPRAAMVLKPVPGHNIRLTFNRAFSSPTALTNSLDILESVDAFGITQVPGIDIAFDGRGVGNRDGFIFQRTDAGALQFLSPFYMWPDVDQGHAITVNDPTFNNDVLSPLGTIIGASMLSQGVPVEVVTLIQNEVLAPQTGSNIVDIGNNIYMLDLETNSFDTENPIDPNKLQDIPAIKNQTTNTYEIGYNGIIAKRMVLKGDFYRSDIADFVSPLTLQTPNVFLDQEDLEAAIQNNLDNATPGTAGLLTIIFDDPAQGGNGNGTAVDELASFAAGVPIGTVEPDGVDDPSLRLTYGNFGNITVYGFDLEAIYFLTEQLKFGATYSFVNKDEFETEGQVIALNAPRHKVNLTTQYDFEKIGLNIGLRWRWQDAFPANSGVYVGEVPALNQLDVSIDYSLPFSKMTHLSLTVQNAYNYNIREFVGVPTMGRLTLFRISHTFGY